MSDEEVTIISENGFSSKWCAESMVKKEEDSELDATVKLESELIIIDSDEEEVYSADPPSPLSVNQHVSQEDADPLSFLGKCSVLSLNLKSEQGLVNGEVSEDIKESERHESLEIKSENGTQDFSYDVKQCIQQNTTPPTSLGGSKVISTKIHIKSEQDLMDGGVSSDEPRLGELTEVKPHVKSKGILKTSCAKLSFNNLQPKTDGSHSDGLLSAKEPADNEGPHSKDPARSSVNVILLHYERAKKLPYACNRCSARFSNAVDRIKHLAIHANKPVSLPNKSDHLWPFACSVCKARFQTEYDLEEHLSIHVNTSFSCDVCSAHFINRKLLKQHLAVHKGQNRFLCAKCNGKFKTQTKFKRHLLLHASGKDYACEKCHIHCKNRSRLQRHLAVVHTEERSFSCSYCTSRFARYQQLQQHLVIHTAEKRFFCEQCSAGFISNAALKRHLLTHSSERHFICDLCPARFVDKSRLQQHVKRWHSGKRFPCEKCSMDFRTTKELKTHATLHSDAKPYSCDLCPKRFKRKELVKAHLATHSRRSFICSQCPKKYKTKRRWQLHLKMHSQVSVESPTVQVANCTEGEEILGF